MLSTSQAGRSAQPTAGVTDATEQAVRAAVKLLQKNAREYAEREILRLSKKFFKKFIPIVISGERLITINAALIHAPAGGAKVVKDAVEDAIGWVRQKEETAGRGASDIAYGLLELWLVRVELKEGAASVVVQSFRRAIGASKKKRTDTWTQMAQPYQQLIGRKLAQADAMATSAQASRRTISSADLIGAFRRTLDELIVEITRSGEVRLGAAHAAVYLGVETWLSSRRRVGLMTRAS